MLTPLGHINLIPIPPVFDLTPQNYGLSIEPGNTNVIVFGLIPMGFQPTIYRTPEEHATYYITDAVLDDEIQRK